MSTTEGLNYQVPINSANCEAIGVRSSESAWEEGGGWLYCASQGLDPEAAPRLHLVKSRREGAARQPEKEILAR